MKGITRISFSQKTKLLWLFLFATVLSEQVEALAPSFLIFASSSQRRTTKPSAKRKSATGSPHKRRNKSNDSLPVKKLIQTKSQSSSSGSSSNNNNRPPASKPRTLGEAVQQAQTVPELLEVASQFWLPTDDDLPSHLRTQAVHHERRQRWSAQLLSKLGTASLHSSTTMIWQDERFSRAVSAAALPFDPKEKISDKDLRTVREALLGLHTLVGPLERQEVSLLNQDILQGIQLLIDQAEANADRFVLPDALEIRWAVRGLVARLGNAVAPINDAVIDLEDALHCDFSNLQHCLNEAFPGLNERAKGLPFDIIPAGVDFADLTWLGLNDLKSLESQEYLMVNLQECIPFHYDTIVTRHGDEVVERRGTAWVAEDGIGALAYSGKLMKPAPLPELVRSIMRQVESVVGAPEGAFFDCALCNYYPEGEAACKFHTDPEHGTMWERLNCVISVGDSRRFAFRPIPRLATWSEYDRPTSVTGIPKDSESAPAAIRVFPGDIVSMWADCNDNFHHAVYPEQETIFSRDPGDLKRVSLVLKRAIPHGNKGRRGHGLAGEGRRSRRQKLQP